MIVIVTIWIKQAASGAPHTQNVQIQCGEPIWGLDMQN